jgi:hypothetical protein
MSIDNQLQVHQLHEYNTKKYRIVTGPGFAGACNAALSNASICFLTFQTLEKRNWLANHNEQILALLLTARLTFRTM